MTKSKVYYTKEITPESLQNIYEKLGVDLSKYHRVGVKVSTGEDGAKGYLKADLIGPFVKSLNGTIIECNTAYPGTRNTAEDHVKVAEAHGFTSFAPVDIMGGFGANLKNQSIGIASRDGKAYIHSCGKTKSPKLCWVTPHKQIDFIESMAEAAKAVADYLAENNKPIIYITVMNNLSLDCDCDVNQGEPVMQDLGIVASLDPVANDQAFIDLIWQSDDPGAAELKERIDSREGRAILPYAESLGLGSCEYELEEI